MKKINVVIELHPEQNTAGGKVVWLQFPDVEKANLFVELLLDHLLNRSVIQNIRISDNYKLLAVKF